MVEAYTVADLRRIEKRLACPDPELEGWEMKRQGFVVDGNTVSKYRRVSGGMGFTSDRPSDLIYKSPKAGTAKASFTTEIGINDTAGMGPQATLPARYWRPGGPIYTVGFRARGIIGSVTSPTYTFSLRLGAINSITGPIVLGSAALTGANNTGQVWEFEGEITMETIGADGANSTVRGVGLMTSPGLASPFLYAIFGGAASPGTVATVDASITNFINFNVACSASSATNSITLLQLLVFGWD